MGSAQEKPTGSGGFHWSIRDGSLTSEQSEVFTLGYPGVIRWLDRARRC